MGDKPRDAIPDKFKTPFMPNECRGDWGTAIVDGMEVSLNWKISETDVTHVRGFLALPEADFTFYNIVFSSKIKEMTDDVYRILDVPLRREMENFKLVMKRCIILENVKLYLEKGDPQPEATIEQMRAIVPAYPSIGHLYIGFVNLTPIRWRD